MLAVPGLQAPLPAAKSSATLTPHAPLQLRPRMTVASPRAPAKAHAAGGAGALPAQGKLFSFGLLSDVQVSGCAGGVEEERDRVNCLEVLHSAAAGGAGIREDLWEGLAGSIRVCSHSYSSAMQRL